MTSRFSAFFYVVLVALCGFSHGAWACRMTNDYDKPTNFDLVHLVDAIVVATPQSQKNVGKDPEFPDYEVTFSINQVIKGDIGPVFTSQTGFGSASIPALSDPSDPDDLHYAHPESYSGPCIRQSFDVGRSYVLFLSKADDGTYYRPLYAWARVAEDYYGEDSLWMTTIRYYLDVQKQEPDRLKQMDILRKKYEELVAKKEMTDYEAELAQDIFYHLGNVSEYKPTAYLLEEYQALEEGRSNRFAIAERAEKIDAYLTRKAEREAAKIKAERLVAGLPEKEEDPFGWDEDEPEEYDPDDDKVRVIEDLMGGEHPGVMPFFDEVMKKEGHKLKFLNVIAEFYSRNGRYHEALELFRNRAFVVLNTADYWEAWQFFRSALWINHDPNDPDKEKWADDAEVKVWWPEFAYSMYSTLSLRQELIQRQFFPVPVAPDPDAIKSELNVLRPQDYRSRPDLAVLLAELYQDPVTDWAEREIESYVSDPAVKRDPNFLALPVLVFFQSHFYAPEYHVQFKRYFCSGKEVRAEMLKQLGQVRGIFGQKFVYYFTSYKDYSDEERGLLISSLISLAAREYWFETEWVASYIQGEPLKMETLVTEGDTPENIRGEVVLVELGDYLRSTGFRDEDEDEEPIQPLVCSSKP
ncbi:MAG: hypothetical protein KDI90_05145 [Alphaproteobacteria bacterium]|nr:hypothetical protein [Alphaproteobacteria bacterium]MCB9975612.1 hypothetical protein [Rhodospirillales bacterium]